MAAGNDFSDGWRRRPAAQRVPAFTPDGMAPRPASLADVAHLAGVSAATASRALAPAQRHPVAEVTRGRVEAAASQLGYRPNPLARGLRARRASTIGVMVHDVADGYFAEIVRGATAEAARAGFLTMVCSSDRDPATELRYADTLIDHRVAALLFAGGGLRDQAYQEAIADRAAGLASYGAAVVSLAPRVERWPSEVTDDRGGARLATQHLLDLGHRLIVLLTGPDNVQTSRERVAGYLEAMRASHLRPLVESATFTPRAGAAAVGRLLDRGERFTALFAASDTMAIGALSELRRSGLEVPRDVSVVGFGDVPGWEFRTPPLTTIRSGLAQIGAAGVRRALAQLEGLDRPPRVRVHRVELVVRESTRPLIPFGTAT
jgi:LacI family transcriptional regulator